MLCSTIVTSLNAEVKEMAEKDAIHGLIRGPQRKTWKGLHKVRGYCKRGYIIRIPRLARVVYFLSHLRLDWMMKVSAVALQPYFAHHSCDDGQTTPIQSSISTD